MKTDNRLKRKLFKFNNQAQSLIKNLTKAYKQ